MRLTIDSYSPKTPKANCMRVNLGKLSIYFSYQTPIAFFSPSTGWAARKNEWGQTTGRHLTIACSGANPPRASGEEFERLLEEAIEDAYSEKLKAENEALIKSLEEVRADLEVERDSNRAL
jgi:hypothetical protein